MGTLSRAESVKDHFLAGRTRSIKFSSMVEAFDVQIPPWGTLDRAYHKSKSKNAGPYRVRTAFENLAAKVAALFRARELTCTVSYLAKGKLSKHPGVNNGGPLWYILWDTENMAHLYIPRSTGLQQIDQPGRPTSISRPIAIMLLHECWDFINHYGDIPGYKERDLLSVEATDEDRARGLMITRAWLDDQLNTSPKKSLLKSRERAMVAAAKTGISRWMLDSGASNHLAGKKELMHLAHKFIKLDETVELVTAAGTLTYDEVLDVYIPALDHTVRVP